MENHSSAAWSFHAVTSALALVPFVFPGATESAIELVNEVRNELNYDLTYFYENKLGKEIIVKKKLEDKEREISLKLEDVTFNIDKIKGSIKMIGESEVLSTALVNLEKRRKNLDSELNGIKELQYNERIKL